MRLRVIFVKLLTRVVERTGNLISHVQFFLYGLLPALLPPEELSGLTRTYYDRSYRALQKAFHPEAHKWTLEDWEADVVTRHLAMADTVVVLGAGLGRESLVLARQGHRVLGLDHNYEGLLIAGRRARSERLPVTFARADFLALPVLPATVDCIFMSGVMYSAIPGRTPRQTCVRHFRTALRQGGKAVLNFVKAHECQTETHRTIQTVNRWIQKLPGCNPAYQLGDFCSHSHFMHAFLDEAELRSELTEAGATILELNWDGGFAVIA